MFITSVYKGNSLAGSIIRYQYSQVEDHEVHIDCMADLWLDMQMKAYNYESF